MVRNISNINKYILTIFRNMTYTIRNIQSIKEIIAYTKRNISYRIKKLQTQQKNETDRPQKTPSANIGSRCTTLQFYSYSQK